MPELTLIVPYYRNCGMLARQVGEWNIYPEEIKIICVDDGSPEPAAEIIAKHATPKTKRHLELYRIDVDIPWNRGGARNLGAKMAATEWVLHEDIDHILPIDAACALLDFRPDHERWYRFPRWRVGKADATRRKDAIPEDQQYGQIHPHVDSYLARLEIYWQIGGYNEDYSGCLGGGNPFLHRLEAAHPVEMLPKPIRLEVYTRSAIPDASDWSLSRDTTEYRRRKRAIEKYGELKKPRNPIRFPWTKILL